MTSRILIIDPSATNRIVLKVRLTAALYTVDVAASPEQALDYLSRATYEAVLLARELDRADSSGLAASLSLLQRCKANPDRHITVICMQDTAVEDEAQDWERKCWSLGADDCLARPIPSDLLLARLRNLMRDGARRLDLPKATHGDYVNGPTAVGSISAIFISCIGPPEVVSDTSTQSRLALDLSTYLGAAIEVREQPLPALTKVSQSNKSPGVLILDTAEGSIEQALALLPQVHSSAVLRDARVVLRAFAPTPQQLAKAFDLGAHEAVCATMPSDQLAIRVQRQSRLHSQESARKSQVNTQLQLAITDPLTGLHNRRYAMEFLTKLATDQPDHNKGFALLALDVDHFKGINDSHGHGVGDQVLMAIGASLKSNVRTGDLVARTGGEEFLIALRETNHEFAKIAAERLRQQISKLSVDTKLLGHPISVTISIGLTMQNGDTRLERILERADQALYAAKAKGRNVVSLCSDAA